VLLTQRAATWSRSRWRRRIHNSGVPLDALKTPPPRAALEFLFYWATETTVSVYTSWRQDRDVLISAIGFAAVSKEFLFGQLDAMTGEGSD